MKTKGKPKYELGTVMVELTRRCNMKCSHCLRGPAQCRDMSDEVMDRLGELIQGRDISIVHLGGGENALVPHRVERLMNIIERSYVSTFSLVTNGKRFTEEFMKVVARASTEYNLSLSVSSDNLHERVNYDRLVDRLYGVDEMSRDKDRFGFGLPVREIIEGRPRKYDCNDVLKMGRGATDFVGYCYDLVKPYLVESDDDNWPALCDDMFYVDVDGNVWPSCDLSYRFMRMRKDLSLGNIMDPGFDWFEAAVKFNLRHADKFPLKLVEPGFENERVREAYSLQTAIETSAKNIALTVRVANEYGIKLTDTKVKEKQS